MREGYSTCSVCVSVCFPYSGTSRNQAYKQQYQRLQRDTGMKYKKSKQKQLLVIKKKKEHCECECEIKLTNTLCSCDTVALFKHSEGVHAPHEMQVKCCPCRPVCVETIGSP